MGLEFTRGNNTRCPPFLVGGLMIMCLFLLCNWWSLSSQNFELLRQNDNLAEQLRINGEELRKCKDCQNQLAKQEVQIRQIKDSDQELQQLQLQCQKEKEMCQTELESTKKVGESQKKFSEMLKSEKVSLTKDFDEEKKKNEQLQIELQEKNDKINKLERTVDEKIKKITELERSMSSVKGNNGHQIDFNVPIVNMLDKNSKKKENLGNNQKIDLNDSVAPRQENVEPNSLREENNGGEAKNDDAGAEAGDPREEEMLDPQNNVENS